MFGWLKRKPDPEDDPQLVAEDIAELKAIVSACYREDDAAFSEALATQWRSMAMPRVGVGRSYTTARRNELFSHMPQLVETVERLREEGVSPAYVAAALLMHYFLAQMQGEAARAAELNAFLDRYRRAGWRSLGLKGDELPEE